MNLLRADYDILKLKAARLEADLNTGLALVQDLAYQLDDGHVLTPSQASVLDRAEDFLRKRR